MNDHLTIGVLGEQCAASYLKYLDFSIIDRNVRTKFGELDIVAKEPSGSLVIVEVKTLVCRGSISPEDNLTLTKFRKLSRMANFYANQHPDLIDELAGWRIDLLAIVLDPPLDSQTYQYGKINFAVSHYKNISL